MNRTDLEAPTLDSKEQQAWEALRSALKQMAAYTSASGDDEQSEKFLELDAKLQKGLLTAAFCGHFSAGKSTLVNAVCGKHLLPSSPIPTSANVVTIVNGAPSARMTFRKRDGSLTETRTIPVSDLHGFAVDGEGVASIEVSYPVPILGDRMAIVDTPGVDSTDSAHRAATESALHLADIVFYVTDYNHVLSDVNFRFLRGLAEWGKPVYLIVNQVDKHRESEVSFAVFRDGIVQAMEVWRIRPAGILFLSLRHPEHPLSQWEELLSLLTRLQPLRQELMVRSAVRSAAYLADRFKETLRSRSREERDGLLTQLGETEEGFEAALAEQRQKLSAERGKLEREPAERQAQIRDELDRILAGANLTPAETRDKAAAVLESMQPGFKAGWLAGAAKTEAERGKRLSALADDFNRQIQAALNGHVRTLLRGAARKAGWSGEPMEASLESLTEPVTGEWLKSRVKPGMGADGQATLHYAAEISADVKADYRREALRWTAELEKYYEPVRERETRRLDEETGGLERKEKAAAALKALDDAETAERDRLFALLPADLTDSGLELPAPVPIDVPVIADQSNGETAAVPLQSAEPGTTAEEPDFPLGASGEAAALLERAASVLAPVPALSKTVESLRARASRFQAKRFTIALFGAFSAGKSSFANALVGTPALPVSPNPTTATINRIVAPSEDLPHGVARVTMKTTEAMLADLRHSLRRLGVSRSEIEPVRGDAAALLGLAARMSSEEVHPKGKPHLAFLRAASEGWTRYAEQLGTVFTAGNEAYRMYAADEQASCFVSEIDLAVDSPMTRGGAVLVDTPGADSINARHTGVAFEYIKNADAVFFVTYYNHAFTEADRLFLNQLGSVKDAFELDKMFFVINAADLASSEEELQAVKAHVAAQLLKHGIRNPRLFGVSSLEGLLSKQTGRREQMETSGLAAFESSFRAFAETELGSLAMAGARKELERAGKQLDGWLESAFADAATREEKAKRLLLEAQSWRERGAAGIGGAAVQPLLQEASEQLYHLRQRVYYRFGEHFQNAFHPSVLQDDGRDLKKLLAGCFEDLKRSLSEDLQQELRSAGLRLEQALQRAAAQRIGEAAAELAAEGYSPATEFAVELELPVEDPFAEQPYMDIKKLWQAFKSPKHFFEQEGAKALREQMSGLLFQAADEWLSSLQERWKEELEAGCRRTLGEAYAGLADELSDFARNLGQSILDAEEHRQLEGIRDEWRRLILQ